MTELRKKENLHKKWAEQVGEPIRRELDRQIHSRRLPALERRRQQLYDDYLTHVNRKVSQPNILYTFSVYFGCNS